MVRTSNNPLRICQIWSYFPPTFAGGAIRFNQLTPGLKAQGVKIRVMTPRWQGTSTQEVINGASVQRLPIGPFKNRNLQSMLSAFPLLWQIWQ